MPYVNSIKYEKALNKFHIRLSDSKLCLVTHWMTPDMEDCPLVVETIPDLDDVIVTAGLLHY